MDKKRQGDFYPLVVVVKGVGIRGLNHQTKEWKNDFVKNFTF